MTPRSARALLRSLLAALADPVRADALASLDAEPTLALARHHRLTPLLHARCGARLGGALGAACRHDRFVTLERNEALGRTLATCLDAFADARVPVIVLKGLAYEATLYEEPGVRITSDADLLVREEDRRRAFAVLDGLGFEPRAAAPGFDEPDYHEVSWLRGDRDVDLHMALAPRARGAIDARAVWDEAVVIRLLDRDVRTLSPTHAVLFHAVHMAIDHFDVPASQCVDLARLETRALPETVDRTARAWRCERSLDTARALTASVLGPDDDGRGTNADPIRRRLLDRYGGTTPMPRWFQLAVKAAHFDTLPDLVRYGAIQARRGIREWRMTKVHRRSPRERLRLGPAPARTGHEPGIRP